MTTIITVTTYSVWISIVEYSGQRLPRNEMREAGCMKTYRRLKRARRTADMVMLAVRSAPPLTSEQQDLLSRQLSSTGSTNVPR
jgi:hypothetical protein